MESKNSINLQHYYIKYITKEHVTVYLIRLLCPQFTNVYAGQYKTIYYSVDILIL